MATRVRFAGTYVLLVLVPLGGMLMVLHAGANSATTSLVAGSAIPASSTAGGVSSPSLRLSILLLQVIVIILVSRAMGMILRRFGQPQVVGEMMAGILLGPSLLGVVAPAAYAALFPAGSLRFLNALSQVGLVLFMFLVGLELNTALLRHRGHAAVLTSHASIMAPLFLGVMLAQRLFPGLAGAGVAFTPFALFLGAAMSITAFPVLARILTERGLLRTRLGAVTIACAAVDDVTAWCLLAAVVAVARANSQSVPLWITIGGVMAFGAAVLGVARPLLAVLYRRVARSASTSFQDVVAAVLLLVLASAWVTERLGVHALFGAFLAGVAMPREPVLVRGLVRRFEDVMVTLLLPLFFAYTGLRMSVGMLSSPSLWLTCGAIVGTAVLGKLGGSALAGRMGGLAWREAWTVGALMNTRGLMELVILNVGLDLGIITPALFTMMVIMALATTLLTTPLVGWLWPASMQRREGVENAAAEEMEGHGVVSA